MRAAFLKKVVCTPELVTAGDFAHLGYDMVQSIVVMFFFYVVLMCC